MAENPKLEGILSQLSESVKAICALPECRTVSKKMYCNLVRRVKLLSPLFEELQDGAGGEELGDDVVQGLDSLRIALDSAFELLKSAHEGSKIFQVYICVKIEFFLMKNDSVGGEIVMPVLFRFSCSLFSSSRYLWFFAQYFPIYFFLWMRRSSLD